MTDRKRFAKHSPHQLKMFRVNVRQFPRRASGLCWVTNFTGQGLLAVGAQSSHPATGRLEGRRQPEPRSSGNSCLRPRFQIAGDVPLLRPSANAG
jgi:hypothetical protein